MVSRPGTVDGLRYDDPMYQTYRWVAMLDPAELADGRDEDGMVTDEPPVTLEDLRTVTHADRPAWQALLRPTDIYPPGARAARCC